MTTTQAATKTYSRKRITIGFRRYHRIEVKDSAGVILYHCDFIRCDHADALVRKLSAHPDFRS